MCENKKCTYYRTSHSQKLYKSFTAMSKFRFLVYNGNVRTY